MNPELKKKWTDALRSDKYRQGKYALHNRVAETHCCLGVLADVAGLELTDDGTNVRGENGAPGGYEPLEELLNGHSSLTFWRMNDRDGKTFAEIADYIEEQL